MSTQTCRSKNLGLETALTAAGIAVHRAGDCLVARGVLEATAQGHAVGMAI